MTGHDWFAGAQRGFQAGALAGMGDIRDNPDTVHSINYLLSELTQAGVTVFAAAVSQGIAAIVGQVHHPHPEFGKSLQGKQALGY